MKLKRLRSVTEEIAVQLSDVEFREKARLLVESLEEIRAEKDKQGLAKKEMSVALSEIENRRDELAAIVRRRTEKRDVAVNYELDEKSLMVHVTDASTGEVYYTRPLKADERQLSIV